MNLREATLEKIAAVALTKEASRSRKEINFHVSDLTVLNLVRDVYVFSDGYASVAVFNKQKITEVFVTVYSWEVERD